jgi:hypothetical protein
MNPRHWLMFLIGISLIFPGCPHHQRLPEETRLTVFTPDPHDETRIGRNAPLFVAYGAARDYNRIGRPKAEETASGVRVRVDIQEPVFYVMEKAFVTARGSRYTNLFYRVHFPEVPFSLIPFYLTSGNNVGLMVVLTLDSSNRPVLVTTVHTCGCYAAILPTDFLDPSSYPQTRQQASVKVYGELLPTTLVFSGFKEPRLLVHLRPGVHRVMDLEVVEPSTVLASESFQVLPSALHPMQQLRELPLNGDSVSFFHETGFLKGYVKGSVKPWESLLLSLISLDPFVGTDKAYADPAETGNPFYTSLKPWNRHHSNMWFFAEFLEFWGWRLP